MEKIQAVRDMTIQLPLINDPHSEFVLLRSCFSLPKVMFLLRSIDPTHHQELWRLFDSMIRDTLTNILGSSVTDQQWAQGQLPVSMGGLGLRSAEEHLADTYISSVLSSESLREGLLPHRKIDINLSSATLLLNTKVQEELTQEEMFSMSQKAISVKINLKLQSVLDHSFTDM